MEELKKDNENSQQETADEIQEKTVVKEMRQNNQIKFCAFCGGQIVQDKEYCEKCGKSARVEGQKHCIACGEVLQREQKFCMNCGRKANNLALPKGVEEKVLKLKKIGKKQLMIGVIAVAAVVLFFVGKPIVSKMLVSVDEYLEQGDYEKAYKKAGKKEKASVLIENLVAYLCVDVKDSLKNPESFKLREIYFDESESEIVLRIQGSNSYGGTVSSYYYYTFDEDDREYQLYTSVSDFEEEETYSWDDLEEKLEKILENAAKESVKKIISSKSNKLSSDMVKRINSLNEDDILEDVKLLEETETLYPTEEA